MGPERRGAGGGALADALLVVAGKLTVIGALFLSGVVAARVLGPDAYGRYAAALSLVLLLDGVAGAPLDLASVRFASAHGGPDGPSSERVARFLGATFRIKLALAGIAPLAAAAAILAGPWPGMTPYLALATAASLAGLLLLRATATFLQARMRFDRYAAVDVIQALLRLGLALGLALVPGAGPAGYLLAYGGTSLLLFLLFTAVIPQPYLRAPWPEREDARAVLAFAGLTSLVVGLSTLTGRLDVVLLAATSAPELGAYAVAAQLAGLATLLAGYVSVVTQPRILPAAREGTLRRLLALNGALAAAVAAIALPLGPWLAEPAVALVFGDAYRPAAALLLVLLIGTWIDLLSMPVLIPFALQMRLRSALAIEVAVTAAFLIAAPLAAREGVLAMAWVMTAVRAGKLAGYLGLFLTARRPPARP